jgi:hypothetical protein
MTAHASFGGGGGIQSANDTIARNFGIFNMTVCW